MPILTEVSIKSIALRLRPSLVNLQLDGISEWNPVFSNGHGLGDGETLVVFMRPTEGGCINLSTQDNMRILTSIRQSLVNTDIKLANIRLVTKMAKDGFYIVARLERT